MRRHVQLIFLGPLVYFTSFGLNSVFPQGRADRVLYHSLSHASDVLVLLVLRTRAVVASSPRTGPKPISLLVDTVAV